MTVADLKKELDKYPDTMDVLLDERHTSDFSYVALHSVLKNNVSFSDEDRNVLENIDCLILSE